MVANDTKALAYTVQTLGTKADRYNVFPEPKSGSTTVANVSGDSKFEIVSTSGEWVFIKVLGVKQGCTSSEDMKL